MKYEKIMKKARVGDYVIIVNHFLPTYRISRQKDKFALVEILEIDNQDHLVTLQVKATYMPLGCYYVDNDSIKKIIKKEDLEWR